MTDEKFILINLADLAKVTAMPHPLQAFLDKTKQTQNAFAKAHRFDVSNVNRVIRGERIPSVAFAKRLAAATGHRVRWTQFFDWKKAA